MAFRFVTSVKSRTLLASILAQRNLMALCDERIGGDVMPNDFFASDSRSGEIFRLDAFGNFFFIEEFGAQFALILFGAPYCLHGVVVGLSYTAMISLKGGKRLVQINPQQGHRRQEKPDQHQSRQKARKLVIQEPKRTGSGFGFSRGRSLKCYREEYGQERSSKKEGEDRLDIYEVARATKQLRHDGFHGFPGWRPMQNPE